MMCPNTGIPVFRSSAGYLNWLMHLALEAARNIRSSSKTTGIVAVYFISDSFLGSVVVGLSLALYIL